MAKPFLIFKPKIQIVGTDGLPLSGGKVFIYQAGTSTKIDTYPTLADAIAGTNANPNPITLDTLGSPSNSGTPIDMYVNQTYKMVVTSSTDTDPPTSPLWTEDNITVSQQIVTSSIKTTTYAVVATDRDKLIKCDASGGSFAITLLSAADAGDGFNVKFKKTDNSANTITITASGAEEIDGTNTYTLEVQYDYLEIYSDGVKWFISKGVPPSFDDSNGVLALHLTAAASAVNYVDITNAATGNPPIIASAGSDSNVDLELLAKGTGKLQVRAGDSSTPGEVRIYEASTNGTNYIGLASPASVSANKTYTLPSSDGSASTLLQTNGSGTLSFSTLTSTIATKSDQETGTSTTNPVVPSVQQNHDSAAKVWGNIVGASGALNTPSYGIASVVRNSAGSYTITFSTPFASTAGMVPQITHLFSGGNSSSCIQAMTTTTITLAFYDLANAAFDPTLVFLVIYGRQ